MPISIDPTRAALVNVDLQQCFVDSAPDGMTVLETINRLTAACRDAGMLVVHTRHVLRPDGSNMGVLANIPKIRDGLLMDGAATAAFHTDLIIREGDIRLDKPRFGAFYGTDLELILRSRGVHTIVIAGISTPVCCDTTAREANARDFRVLFLRDGTASTGDGADQFQRATLDVLDGLFADVVDTDDVLNALAAARE